MTRTSRRRFPVRFALAGAALALLFSPVQAQDGSAPAKPTGLTAAVSHDSVTLTWDDPQDDSITGYVILRRNRDTDAQGQFTELAPDTGSAATTYTDDSVAAGTPYTYRIKAVNGHGVSDRSRWFHVDTPAALTPEPPAQPKQLVAEVSRDSVVLTWQNQQDESITGYVIQRRDEEGTFTTVESDTGSAAPKYTDGSVEPGRRYVYRVQAISPNGISSPSRDVFAHTAEPPAFADDSTTLSIPENSKVNTLVGRLRATAPAPPTDVRPRVRHDEDVVLYTLQGPDSHSFRLLQFDGAILTRERVSYDYERKSSYSVTVTASNGKGESDSIAVTIMLTDMAEQPGAPQNLQVRGNSNTSLDVSWNQPNLGGGPEILRYVVEVRKALGGAWTNVRHNGVATSATITGLSPGTAYQVRVKADNVEIPSRWRGPARGVTSGRSPDSEEGAPEPESEQVPIVSVRIVSNPGQNGIWDVGERVVVQVQYSATLRLDVPAGGTSPQVALAFLTSDRKLNSLAWAEWTGGSGTDTLSFSYTVTAAAAGGTQVIVPDNGVLLRDARICVVGTEACATPPAPRGP